MRVRAFYQEYIIPNFAEEVNDKLSYREDLIPIMLYDLTQSNEVKEYIKGLKSDEYSLVVKLANDKYEEINNTVKVRDKLWIFGKEYRVKKVDERIINEKFVNKIARNNALYNRYVEKVLILE
jgi:hypothetical protein